MRTLLVILVTIAVLVVAGCEVDDDMDINSHSGVRAAVAPLH